MASERTISRRDLTIFGAMGATMLAMPSQAITKDPSSGLQYERVMRLVLDIGAGQSLGARQTIPITGGTFTGPRLKGTALAGGGNWLIRRPDGVNELNVRCTLETDDQHLIYMWYRGIVHTTSGGGQRVRTTLVFETLSDTYRWLNRILAVGVGYEVGNKITCHIYEIL